MNDNNINNNEKNINERKPSIISKYGIYLEIFGVLFVVCCIILCFLPICNGSYFDYYAMTSTNNNDDIDEETANEIKEASLDVNTKIAADSLEIQREVLDVVNDFFNDIKNENYEEAYTFLAEPTYSNEEKSIKYVIEYNKGYNFFKTYLSSYDISSVQATVLDDIATVTVNLKRYDINRIISKMIKEKQDEGDDFENLTYEEELFEYENYLKEEFSKINPYTKNVEFLLGLVKDENGDWKLVNNDDITSNVLNLEFKITKPEELNVE